MDRVTCRESCKRHMAVSEKARRGKRGFSTMANDICTGKWTTSQLSCSFAFPELLKSALVLVLVLLVVFLLDAAHLIFAFLLAPKKRQIGGVFAFALQIPLLLALLSGTLVL